MCRRHTGRIRGVHRAEAPAIESTVRRSRAAAEPPSRSRLLGPERSREQETNSECLQLPETGPEGRIYRQLGDMPATAWAGRGDGVEPRPASPPSWRHNADFGDGPDSGVDNRPASIGLSGRPSLSHHGRSLLQSSGTVAVFLLRVPFSGRMSGPARPPAA